MIEDLYRSHIKTLEADVSVLFAKLRQAVALAGRHLAPCHERWSGECHCCQDRAALRVLEAYLGISSTAVLR